MNKTTRRCLLVGLCSLIPVASLYAFNPDIDSSLVACWKLDETSGTVAADSSGNGNNGTLKGNPTWIPGKLKGCLSFGGSSDYVDCGNAAIFTFKDAITVSAWANIRSTPVAWMAVVAKGENAWRISCNNTAMSFHFGITYWTNANYAANGTKTVNSGEWHLITGTFDGKDIKLYLDGALDATTATTSNIGTSTTNLFIGENPEAAGRYWNGMIDDVRVYRRALSIEEIGVIMSGLWTPVAENPYPADKQTDVVRDVVLSWKPGPAAAAHDVYLGTSLADVNAASASSRLCVSKGQDANSYVPPALLDYGVTYYWRVDEINATDSTPVTGVIWSFTTEPIGYPVKNITATASSSFAGSSPQSTVDGSGLTGDLHGIESKTMWSSAKNPAKPVWLQYDFDKAYKLYQMLVWNSNGENELELGYGLQDVTIEYSTDGTDYLKLGDFVFNQATALPDYKYNTVVDFGGIVAKSVRITATSNYDGPRYGLAEVRFLYIPVWAREPKPASDSNNIDPTTVAFSWRAGREAASQTVYLGTDPNALTLVGTPTANSFTPQNLNVGVKYYWRVDEANAAEKPPSWTGDVWNFTAADFRLVDDFERYNDAEGTAVFNTWVDGYNTGTNGGQIGYDIPGPYMDKTTRHSGNQCTPFYYKNTDKAVNYSEATRTFDAAQDWTIAKADTLRIWVRGRTADLPTGTLPAATTAFDITSAGSDIYQATDQFRFVYRQLTGDGSITAKIESQQPTNQYAKAGVMIRVGLDVGAMETHMVTLSGANNTTTTPKQVEWNFRPTVGDATARTVSTTPATTSTWVRLTRKGDVFTGDYSADGVTWVTTGLTTTPQTIPMGSAVNIGLIVCSHVATTVGEVKFSNVKVTGNVTGEWQKADVGITAQPAGNTADTFYLAVEDDAGHSRIVVPTPTNPACTSADWQAVDVSFSQFTGVTMTKVKKVTFGVGDKTGTSPQHGSGLLYIDDIGVGHPPAK